VTGIQCALLCIAAVLQLQEPFPEGPRGLYQRAARLIAEARYRSAAETLETLLAQHDGSELASVARIHLAECYLALEDYSAAYEILTEDVVEWSDEQSQRIVRLQALAARAAAGASQRKGEYAEAFGWLEKCQAMLRPAADAEAVARLRHDQLRVAVAACMKSIQQDGDPAQFIASLPEEQRSPVRFALAELLYSQSQYDLALTQYDLLAEQSLDSGDIPPWAASLALRRADIHIRKQQHITALALIRDARQRFPEFAHAYEFDVLLAKSAIDRIDFPSAIAHLQQVIDYGASHVCQPSGEQRARAQWMIGEVYFLQRRYAEAISAYEQVEQFGSRQWQCRALMQQAKCEELAGRRKAAVATYRRLADQFREHPTSEFALARIAQLRDDE
jgi:TolA-binding protein